MTNSPTPRSAADNIANLKGRPQTIPALQEWTTATGTYTFSEHARIVLNETYATQLKEIGDVFAADLKQLTGFSIPVVSESSARDGDIWLSLSQDTALGHEGYVLEVAASLHILAPEDHGIFYGTRTVLQLLRQSYSLPAGTARDWPEYPERSLMVDVGRKYFSLHWLESYIRDLAYLKFNYFHLHLSDNYGFRLESERHPEVMSPQHYTRAEIQQLLELARRYHVTIVPEIDMPGHMDTILAHHPELQLVDVTGKRKPGDIDLGNEQAYSLIKDLLDEFIPLFPGPYWHIGADEYLMHEDYSNYPQLLEYARTHYGPAATERDTYLGFVNWANDIIKSHGKVTRVWNDGLYGGTAITIAKDMVYEHWLNAGLSPQELIEQQIPIMNCNADLLYYVLGPHFPTGPDQVYEQFEQRVFQGHIRVEPSHLKKIGAKLHVWCDHPEEQTENQVAAGIGAILRSLSQANWGSPKLVASYSQYQPLVTQLGYAPGYNIPVDIL
ncbi:family 20 glycosylhydrolase [Dictyobacter kobayashii]|uniref:Uncharacterized protein n=1 Tax=Dictyobacter kobayashii TaxID=2014872 RepID=A0A402AX74_9CHLR|nr:family 20 glycosylhydrolase [Dictyobacter kobayashii]GCE23654.1 hypothetical protein KDK_74540 [Dictyobacter kobayashii]